MPLPIKSFKCKHLVCLSLLLAGLTLAEYSALISKELLSYIDQTYGSRAAKRVVHWQELMQEEQEESEWGKLNLSNKFFNKIRWRSDKEHWQQRDYWATPVEMLATNGGDCEDFSIGKYFTLKGLNIPMEKLRIMYVIATDINQAHMVLIYYETPDSEPLILDNIKKRILPASSRPDLQPIYSFNGDGLWRTRERGSELKSDSKQLFKWNDLNNRLEEEMRKAKAAS